MPDDTAATAESPYADRIRELAAAVEREREAFDSPVDPPAEDRASRLLRDGLGPTVWVYVQARTGGRQVRFSADEFETLEETMNAWLDLYARCYGVDLDADFTIREAAELLVETHNVHDTAQLLTDVPRR